MEQQLAHWHAQYLPLGLWHLRLSLGPKTPQSYAYSSNRFQTLRISSCSGWSSWCCLSAAHSGDCAAVEGAWFGPTLADLSHSSCSLRQRAP